MGIKQDVFGLEQIYRLQVEGNWSTRGDVWTTPSPFRTTIKQYNTGYFAGGYSIAENARISTVVRYDFSNDTADTVSVAELPDEASTNSSQTLGNQSAGYAMGGSNPNASSTVYKIDYSNDTTALTPGAETWIRLLGSSGASNSNYGYLFGGNSNTTSPTGPYTAISRFDFSNDTSPAPIHNNFLVARTSGAAVGNQTHGYYGGGFNYPSPSYVAYSIVDRLDYANDTTQATPKGPLSAGKYSGLLANGNANFGYFAGGQDGTTPPTIMYSAIDRYDYSSDTVTSPPNIYNVDVTFRSSTGNNIGGYYIGAYIPSPFAYYSSISRIDYANDTSALSTRGNNITGAYSGFTFSSVENALPSLSSVNQASVARDNVVPQGTDFGYFGGGNTPRSLVVDRIDYSNDTVDAIEKGSLSLSRGLLGAAGNASGGYFGGGVGITHYSTVDRVDYSNDSPATSPKGPLNRTGYGFGATGNIHFGYWAGGFTPSSDSRVSRIDYSNDDVDASPKGNLSVDRRNMGTAGNQSFGYFAGGSGPLSTIDRISYTNDTVKASPRGPLTSTKRKLAGAGNADFGYLGGGLPPTTAVIERIDYSNDTLTASPKGSLTIARYELFATGSSSFGYFAAGYNNGGTILSMVDRVDYSNDTATAILKGPLSQARVSGAATSPRDCGIPLKGPGILETPVTFGNAAIPIPDFGYFANGGNPGGTMTVVDRIDYSNDTANAVRKSTTTGSTYLSNGAASNHTHAYFMGGFTSSANTSTVERMSFSNGSTNTSTKAALVFSRRAHFGVSNLNFAYNGGGYGSAPSAKIDRVNFSNDTATSLERGPLSAGGAYMSATGNDNFGYAVGSNKTLVQRIDYSNDTASAPSLANLTYTKNHAGALGNANFGYFGGGNQNTTFLERIDYSNDTATTLLAGAVRSTAENYPGTTGSSSFGYFGGGPGPVSTIDRIDFANDSAGTSPRAQLSLARNSLRAASPKEYGHPLLQTLSLGTAATSDTGYFGGGYQGSGTSTTIDRIDYSNDTTNAAPKGSLVTARMKLGAVSSGSFGYFGGGESPARVSTVERVDYSNDTANAVEKGPLFTTAEAPAATGNHDFGYFGGGMKQSPLSSISSIYRIDYSNDIATASPRGDLTNQIKELGATGNHNFGYFGGGQSEVTIVSRLDYSNDSADASPKGPLTTGAENLAATGNANFGYFAGGSTPSAPGGSTLVQRIDYSSDTIDATPKGNLNRTRYGLGATGNANFGYIGGANTPGSQSQIDRIDYSNDTVLATVLGSHLSSNRQYLSATSAKENGFIPIGPSVVAKVPFSSTQYGYFVAGRTYPPSYSHKDRLDYSNDTVKAVTRGFWNAGGYLQTTTSGSSNTHGYQIGSSNSSEVTRMTYANDTDNVVVTAGISFTILGSTATGNVNFGYASGGYNPWPTGRTQVSRIDFANDTTNGVPAGPLKNGRSFHAGTGNQNFGYFMGGRTDVSPGYSSLVDRIDYSNDMLEASPKGPLIAGKSYTGATGNANHGYIGGGPDPNMNALVARVDYANDTATIPARGSLTSARKYITATGNQNFGYFGGGQAVGYSPQSTIDRIDYANDTATASPRGPLSNPVDGMIGMSAASNANPQ